MSNINNSLFNLGSVSKPATVLIEKISDAIGASFRPYQIKRVAKAQAEAALIEAESNIQITDMNRRAVYRWIQEETDKQNNIEKIIEKALPNVSNQAKPQNIDKDWLVNFFDKARLISDPEMQDLWAKILAEEANSPGTFSKRAINAMASIDKKDASMFELLCRFIWQISNTPVPIIFDEEDKIYSENGIKFSLLKHLESIGLISHVHFGSYALKRLPKKIKVCYKDIVLNLTLEKDDKNELEVGSVMLTSVGLELIKLCKTDKIKGFDSYVKEKWKNLGIIID